MARTLTIWAASRLAGVLLLLVLCLQWQRSSAPVLALAPGPRVVLAGGPAARLALPPAAFALARRPPVWVRLVSLRDTGQQRAGNLQRKALPRSRWQGQGGYLDYPLPRRPRQRVLDSAARAARPAP